MKRKKERGSKVEISGKVRGKKGKRGWREDDKIKNKRKDWKSRTESKKTSKNERLKQSHIGHWRP